MVMIRIPDEWPRLARDLSPEAATLFMSALAYSQAEPCGLHLLKDDLPRCTYRPLPVAIDAAHELVAIGWWQDLGDRWFVGGPPAVTALQYTPEQVAQHQLRNRERQARLRDRRSSSSSGGGA